VFYVRFIVFLIGQPVNWSTKSRTIYTFAKIFCLLFFDLCF